jgi:hypothetical protein
MFFLLNDEGRCDATVLLNVVFVLYNLIPINRSPVPLLKFQITTKPGTFNFSWLQRKEGQTHVSG